MTINWQFSEGHGLDEAFKNFGGSDIAAGLAVAVDSSNDIDVTTALDAISIKLPGSEGDPCVGVLMETGRANGAVHARVRVFGKAKCKADGAITAGNPVMATTAGKAKAASTGKVAFGIALTTAADTEDVIVLVGANAYNG